MSKRLTSEELTVADSAEAVTSLYFSRGWTDGLPIHPPTEEAVERMLTGTKRAPFDVIAAVPPSWGEATVEKIAINAVMAGCLPEYMPVLIAAVSAMCEKPVDMMGMQPTTHPVAPLMIVNGPIAKKLDINSKSGAFGPGWRSNATLGRAVRLMLINIGGAFPGKTDMSCQGQPSKYVYCIAENEEDSPWEPLSVSRGFAPGVSTVSIVGLENPHNINDHDALSAEEVLSTIVGSMATLGSNNVRGTLGGEGDAMLALGPEHAQTIAKAGYTRKSLRDYLWDTSRIPRKAFYERARMKHFGDWPEDSSVPPTMVREDLHIIVVGGPGKHSAYLPGWSSHMVTKAIEE